jgi:hypothetical protein
MVLNTAPDEAPDKTLDKALDTVLNKGPVAAASFICS